MNKTLKTTTLLIAISAASLAFAKLPSSPLTSEPRIDKKTEIAKNEKAEDKITFAISDEIKVNQPRPLTVKIYDPVFTQELSKEKIKTDGVVIKGVVQKTNTDQGGALKIYWNAVATEDESKTQSLSTPLKSLLLSNDGIIPSATKLPAYGEKEELKRAIQALASIEPAKAEDNKLQIEPKKNQRTGGSSAFTPGSNSNRTTRETTDFSSDPIKFPEKMEANATYSTTSDGCEPRIDWVSEKVYPTAAQVKITNGNEEKISECLDANIPYDIKYSYTNCTDRVDINTMTVTPYREAYYIDSAGNVRTVKECTAEEGKFYQIDEEAGICNDIIDLNSGKATETFTLAYRNSSNNRIVVEQCTKTKNSRVFDLYDRICAYSPNYEDNLVYISKQKSYDKDGKTYNMTNCEESKDTLPLMWDSASCNNQIDFENMTFTEIARPMVETADGITEYLGICMPKSYDNKVMVSNEGCENLHNDYVNNGYSNGYARYYQLVNGSKRYLTECIEYPKDKYTHKEEITGYLHEDKNYRSFPKVRTYIELPLGKAYVNEERVKDDLSIPYVTANVQNVPMNEFKYEGCFKYERMQKAQTFKRVDESEYYLPIEETAAKLLGDICVLSSQTIDKYYQETLYHDELGGKGIANVTPRGNCVYQYWTAYFGNGYGAAYKRSYTPIEVNTEIRIKTNPETGKEFKEQGLTTTKPVGCPANSNNQRFSYCLMPDAANSWVDGKVVTCKAK